MLAGVTDLNYQGKTQLLFHHRGKEMYVQNTADLLGCLLVLSCLLIKVNGKLQPPNPDKTTDGPDPSRMEVWVTLLGKKHDQFGCLLKAKESSNG